jgi:hypothetical protein
MEGMQVWMVCNGAGRLRSAVIKHFWDFIFECWPHGMEGDEKGCEPGSAAF